jgi:hypothetical protein
MKFLGSAILFILFSYQAQTANVCFGDDDPLCTNINGCDPASGCPGTIGEILRISPTMQDVWQTMQSYFGGKWTVVQTQNANWYSNWGIAVICTCDGVVNILVQQ